MSELIDDPTAPAGLTCALPRRPESTELHPWETKALDIAGCDRTEIVVALYEHEKAGTRFETWPAAVRVLVERELERWLAANETRAVRAVTAAAPKQKSDGRQACILVLHHSPKG